VAAPVVLEPTHLHASIQGVQARAYLGTQGAAQTRLWYAEDLPRPPPAVRRALLLLAPTATTACAPLVAADDERDDADGCPARSVAGRVLLRRERLSEGGWVLDLDTTAISRAPAPSHDPPAGWTDAAPPVSASAARPALRWTLPTPPPLSAPLYLGGPLMTNSELHLFYCACARGGRATEAAGVAVGPDGTAGIAQYGSAPVEWWTRGSSTSRRLTRSVPIGRRSARRPSSSAA
jgi:hypothetical protein